MYNQHITTYFDARQVLTEKIDESYSKSPQKPLLLLEYLGKHDLLPHHFELSTFDKFSKGDFLLAHTSEYVEAVFTGQKPLCESNGIPWSEQLVETVQYTNANLYEAVKESVSNPQQITLSTTSGFHHATPTRGGGFCTFSGQVIASVKLYREFGVRGVYLDLDGHFGNSIENSREFVPDLNEAVPPSFNINPQGSHGEYVEDFYCALRSLRKAILNKEIDYVVFAHGADSHEWDDLGHQCTTEEWLECSTIFYRWVKALTEELKRPFPLTLTLFGGYRKDDYDSVLSLHTADLVTCLNELMGKQIKYTPEVKPKR